MPLTQAQLDAQNKTNGVTQFSSAPIQVGGAIGSDMLVPQKAITPPPQTNNPALPSYVSTTQNYINGNMGNFPVAAPDTSGSAQSQMLAEMKRLGAAPTANSLGYSDASLDQYKTGVSTSQQAEQDARDRVNAINARLNAITQSGNAGQLQQESRLAPMGVITGAQAQIARQAAIEALPLQAEALTAQAALANAQGRTTLAQTTLEQAQQHLDKMYTLQVQDAQAQYNYKKDLITQAIGVADKADAAKLAQTQKEEDRAFQIKMEGIKNTNDINKIKLQEQLKSGGVGGSTSSVTQAIDAGKPVSTIIDPTSTTAKNNMTTLAGIFQSSKISAGNKTSIGNGLALAKAAQDLADANLDGKFEGFSPLRNLTDMKVPFTDINVLPFRDALKRNKTIQNESLISALDLQTQFWASGAALSDGQTALVKKMIPTVTDTDTQIRTKTNQLINYMLSQTASRLVTDGVDFQPAKVDVFETVNLLEKASPAQQAELRAAGLIK